jgi:hypothetical protein
MHACTEFVVDVSKAVDADETFAFVRVHSHTCDEIRVVR